MNCHYCEKEIVQDTDKYSKLTNKKTGQLIHLHYPHCHVRFTTFYKTEKEYNEWLKKNNK